jgi:acetylornithine deacetylase/succinyl-diaminopimelate desuccinylase-like protein
MRANLRISLVLVVLVALAAENSLAQGPRLPVTGALPDTIGEATNAGRHYTATHAQDLVLQLAALVAIPNVATDPGNIRRNAQAIVNLFAERGVHAVLWDSGAGSPAIFAQLALRGARATILFYAHYDGQPAMPHGWVTPPWQPTLRAGRLEAGAPVVDLNSTQPLQPDWRLYGRSTSDDKAAIVALLAALDALRAAGLVPSVNLKFLFEGEEEASSPHLKAILDAHKSDVEADLVLVCDGPVHPSGRQQVFLGSRGEQNLELTVYGPNRPLHSGHYGNWAPNPIMRLAHLLASMRSLSGHVLISNYYDDVVPISSVDRHFLETVPNEDKSLMKELGIGLAEGSGRRLDELILLPSFNAKGIRAGEVGADARHVIVSKATASLDLRLVPAQEPLKVRALVERHIRNVGFTIVRHTPSTEELASRAEVIRVAWQANGYPAYRTDTDSPVTKAFIGLLNRLTGDQLVVHPASGAGVPLYFLHEATRSPVVVVPIANYDNNQHAENENVRLKNLWDGTVLFAGIYGALGPFVQRERIIQH